MAEDIGYVSGHAFASGKLAVLGGIHEGPPTVRRPASSGRPAAPRRAAPSSGGSGGGATGPQVSSDNAAANEIRLFGRSIKFGSVSDELGKGLTTGLGKVKSSVNSGAQGGRSGYVSPGRSLPC